MTRIKDSWLESPASQTVCRILEEGGFRALFVGGCVRNALLKEKINDIDIATNALPEQVVDLFQAAGIKVIPTGIDHGTVTVVSNGQPIEVTTFRRDVSTDGRHAVVAFGDSLEQDARRRDFTMNALYATPDGKIVDPLGGLKDLKDRRVRFIGSTDDRIKEDYLRILRFFRFYAWYGDPKVGPDPDGMKACSKNIAGLETLSRERITSEVLKLLSADNPAPAIVAMEETGVLAAVLPESDVQPLRRLQDLEQKLSVQPDPLRRLAALRKRGEPQDLRLSKKQAARIAILQKQTSTNSNPAALGYRFGYEVAKDILLLRAAQQDHQVEEAALMAARKGDSAIFPVSPNDLMPEFTGPALGRKLKELEAKWIASGFQAGKEELLS